MSGYFAQADGYTFYYDPSDGLYTEELLYAVTSTTAGFATSSGAGGPDTTDPPVYSSGYFATGETVAQAPDHVDRYDTRNNALSAIHRRSRTHRGMSKEMG